MTLESEIRRVADVGKLLVISDFDGVIAPIVDDPARAFPDPDARQALIRLSELPNTDVMLLSGRALDSLSSLADTPQAITLIGSHGAEVGGAIELSDELADRLRQVVDALYEIAADAPGSSVEEKPTSVAFHVRNADPDTRWEILDRVKSGPAAEPGVRAVEGKQVIELMVTNANKGEAVEQARQRVEPDVVVFLGDDVTDEHAFEVLGPADLGIKVGTGETAASRRLSSQTGVAGLLTELAELRAERLDGEGQ